MQNLIMKLILTNLNIKIIIKFYILIFYIFYKLY